jgi:hypothetical protein
MVDIIFLESMVLSHSRREVSFFALMHRGQTLYCKTENKSLYTENSCIMSFNVVSIDCIVVQVVYVEQWLK